MCMLVGKDIFKLNFIACLAQIKGAIGYLRMRVCVRCQILRTLIIYSTLYIF